MKKMSETAKKLDVFFRILRICLDVAGVASLVGLGILAVGLIFNLPPEMIGTGYNSLELGFIELTLAEGFAPDVKLVLGIAGLNLAMGLACIAAARCGVNCVRGILKPMSEGAPFHGTVSVNLKKLAKISLVLGIAVDAMKGVCQALTAQWYGLTELLVSEKITAVSLNYSYDLTFLAVSAVLMLLSYVFRYGEELQKLSDETL